MIRFYDTAMSADSILQYAALSNGTDVEKGTFGSTDFRKDKDQVQFRPHTHQVAGHRVENGKAIFAMLHGQPGRVLKPFQDLDRGQTELHFYRIVLENSEFRRLRTFLPQFHGLLEQDGLYYLELSDLSHDFKEPCIVDIKIGALLYGPEKMTTDLDRISRKYPLARHIGYQILGMKTYCPATHDYLFHDKTYFRELDLDNVIDAGLGLFFQCYRSVRKEIIAAIVEKLDDILAWFNEQKTFVFYGSSLLIMFEGSRHDVCNTHGSETRSIDEKGSLEPHVDVKMIDFTHVFPSDVRDENYLFGLRILHSHFQLLME